MKQDIIALLIYKIDFIRTFAGEEPWLLLELMTWIQYNPLSHMRLCLPQESTLFR
nr:hypothetical protein Iba_chr13bCG3860 [Ipomoea batatas]